MRRMIAVSLACAAFAAGVASADAISEPQCGHGWTAQHAGHSAYCAPHVCTADSECGGGHCVEVARCFRSQPLDTGMIALPPGTPVPTYEAPIDTLCGANDSCAAGSHCTHERECTEPPQGMCSIGFVTSSRAPSLVLVALLAFAARRRNR